jgi:hypothetical protein
MDKEKLTPQYLAGLFDGEGSISMGQCNPGSGWRRILVNLGQTGQEDLIRTIAEIYPGAVTPRKNGFLQINFRRAGAEKLLHCIKDHVIIKEVRVKLAIEIFKLIPKDFGPGQSSPEVQLLRLRLEDLLDDANDTRAITDIQGISSGQITESGSSIVQPCAEVDPKLSGEFK